MSRTVPDGELDRRLAAVVAAQLDVESMRLHPGARLGEDLCVDSLAALELGLVIEDEFDIAIAEEQRERIRTYGDIRAIVESLVSERDDGSSP
ncbi:MAG: phosphopantetheine-binding protein [Acidimicrobiales bacterium]